MATDQGHSPRHARNSEPAAGPRAVVYALLALLVLGAGIVWLFARDSGDSTVATDGPTPTAVEVSPTESPEPTVVPTQEPAGADDGAPDGADDAPADGDPPDEPEPTGPVRADPDAVAGEDAPADVADVLALIADGEAPESRGIVKGGRIYLLGTVPDQETADQLAQLAGEVLGPDNVENFYVIDERAGDAGLGNIRVADDFLFASGSTEIQPEFEPLLNQALALMTIRPEVTLTIVGHSDGEGPEDINLQLSLERAQAVAAWLIEAGVDPERLNADGKGETEPLASNDTPEGRAENRRIEVIIENLLSE